MGETLVSYSGKFPECGELFVEERKEEENLLPDRGGSCRERREVQCCLWNLQQQVSLSSIYPSFLILIVESLKRNLMSIYFLFVH
jgi:hypothetical protein